MGERVFARRVSLRVEAWMNELMIAPLDRSAGRCDAVHNAAETDFRKEKEE
jgi:hypothetical protein